MENAEEAINQLNNFTFDGRALKVNVARENPQGGGSRGFGRSGGFGNRNRNRNY